MNVIAFFGLVSVLVVSNATPTACVDPAADPVYGTTSAGAFNRAYGLCGYSDPEKAPPKEDACSSECNNAIETATSLCEKDAEYGGNWTLFRETHEQYQQSLACYLSPCTGASATTCQLGIIQADSCGALDRVYYSCGEVYDLIPVREVLCSKVCENSIAEAEDLCKYALDSTANTSLLYDVAVEEIESLQEEYNCSSFKSSVTARASLKMLSVSLLISSSTIFLIL